MIIINTAQDFYEEIKWVSHVVFDEFLGLDYRVEISKKREYFDIFVEKKCISTRNIFLLNSKTNWLADNSVFLQETKFIQLKKHFNQDFFNESLPIIFGESKIDKNDERISIDFDILGTIFFMLSGYEDAVKVNEDEHNRLPFKESFLSEFNLIDRPIVDEYVELLWILLSKFDNNLKKKCIPSKLLVSCDVDNPYSSYINSFQSTFKKIIGDIIKRKSIFQAANTLLNYLMSKLKIYTFDPLDKINWMMDLNEKVGNTMCFYFIFKKSDKTMDGHYSINEKRIRSLIKNIINRGHEVGTHLSYKSYLDFTQISSEIEKLREVFHEEKISQPRIGNRQHYLKFSSLETFRLLDDAGVAYDSSVAFAEHIGFRVGTSRAYSMYDLRNRKKLNIIQKPLLVMEDSLFSESYMGLNNKIEIIEKISLLKKATDYFGGNFTLLWHNSSLNTSSSRNLYESILRLFQ